MFKSNDFAETNLEDLPPKGSALVIGLNKVDTDHYAGWSGELAGALNDANATARLAKQSASTVPGGDSETITLLDERATRQGVKEKILEAAAYLRRGDLFLLYFAGFGGVLPQIGGASAGEVHKTWCLYDGQFLEEELYSLLVNFHSGVRVLIIKDASHTGFRTQERYAHDPDLHQAVSSALTDTGVRARSMPQKVASQVYLHNKDFYDNLLRHVPPISVSTGRIHASVQLLAASKDNQDALERDSHGLFSESLFRALDFGRFDGGHDDLHQAIVGSMPPLQTPHHELVTDSGESFVRHQPLSLSNAVIASPNPVPATKIVPPDAKTPSQFTNSYSIAATNNDLTVSDIGTIEFWAAARGWPKWKLRTEDACIFSVQNGGFALLVSMHRDKLLLKIGDQTFSVAFDWTDGKYHHLSINPVRGQLKMDGDTLFDFKVDYQTKASLLTLPLSPFTIGANAGAQFFEGDIRGLRLWKNSLLPEEIQISANFSAKSTQPPLPPNLPYNSGVPGLAPTKLLAYQYQVANKKSLFVFHLDPAGSWIYNIYAQAVTLQVETVTDSAGTQYGSVEYVPFIGLFRDLEQNLLLATDEKTEPIKLIPSGPNTYTIDGAPKISLVVGAGDSCTDFVLSNRCIQISGPVPNTRLTKGYYTPSMQDGENKSFTQTFGDVFTRKGTNIEMMLLGWVPYDQAYNPLFPGQKTADNNVFSFPDSDSKRYREGQEGSSIATPYGLFRRTVSFKSGSFSSTLVTSIQEYEREVIHVVSFDLGQDANVLFLSSGHSYSRTQTLKDVNAKIVEHDQTYAVTHFMKLDYSAFLERRNATLSDNFKQDIQKLVTNPNPTLIGQIIEKYGTHYANAITYGGRGISQSTLQKDSVVNLVKNGVNIKQGLNFNLGLDFDGLGITDRGSISTEDGSEILNKITNENETHIEKYNCYGSVGCDGGKPSSGSEDDTQPLFLDLRPLSDLLAPPFYSDYATVVTARKKLQQAIQAKAAEELKAPKTGILFIRLSVKVITDLLAVSVAGFHSGNHFVIGSIVQEMMEVPTLSVSAVVGGDTRVIIQKQAIQPLNAGKYIILAVPAGADTIELQMDAWEYSKQVVRTDDETILGVGDQDIISDTYSLKVAKAVTARIPSSDLSPRKEVQGTIQSSLDISLTDTHQVMHFWLLSAGMDDPTSSTDNLGTQFEIGYSLKLLQPNQVFTGRGLGVNEIV